MRPRRRVVYHWQVMADSKPAVLQGAAATSFVAAVERVKPHTKLIGLLAFGHLVIDLNQGSIPAVLPFLRNAHGLSYAEAATIVLVGTLTSSLIQPVFGYLSDQIARRWILPASVFLAGAGLALTGIAPGYLAVLGLVLVMGLGVAAWHPEGYKAATGMAGEREATAPSWFSPGGNIGLAPRAPPGALRVPARGGGWRWCRGPPPPTRGRASLHALRLPRRDSLRARVLGDNRPPRVRYAGALRRGADVELLGVDRARPGLPAPQRGDGLGAHRRLRHRRRGPRRHSARLGRRPLGPAGGTHGQRAHAARGVRHRPIPARAARPQVKLE